MSDTTKRNHTEETVKAMAEVLDEYRSAREKHGPFASGHEAYAVILEELEELWEEVKQYNKYGCRRELCDPAKLRVEAKQVAAMAVAMMVEVAGDGA